MKAVQIDNNRWLVPDVGHLWIVLDEDHAAYSKLQPDHPEAVNNGDIWFDCSDLPAFLRRCGYTLVWLDGRVESADEKASTVEQAVFNERVRILNELDRWEEDGEDIRLLTVDGIVTRFVPLDDVRAIVSGGKA